jgi:hypothetical protein
MHGPGSQSYLILPQPPSTFSLTHNHTITPFFSPLSLSRSPSLCFACQAGKTIDPRALDPTRNRPVAAYVSSLAHRVSLPVPYRPDTAPAISALAHAVRRPHIRAQVWECGASIYGGFVRDWVVRGRPAEDVDALVPPGKTVAAVAAAIRAAADQRGLTFVGERIKGAARALTFDDPWSHTHSAPIDFLSLSLPLLLSLSLYPLPLSSSP